MAIVRVLVGLPGSGKSTYAAELHERGWVVNSSDAIREELYGTADDQSHNDEIFNAMYRRTINAIVANFNCVYDATNLSAKRRAALIKSFKSNKSIPTDTRYEVAVIATPYAECLKRNLARERHVPAYVIQSMMKRFEMPAEWEGWDEILVFGNDRPESITKAAEFMTMAEHIPHDNPHHTLTIGHHMQKAYALYTTQERNFDYAISQAILWHDIAKPYCKTFTNMRGEKTDIAHYYGHANASAYLYLSWLAIANINGTLRPIDSEIVNLIQNHMVFFDGEKRIETIKKRYGEKFVEKLNVVHKYDLLAK